MQSNFKILMKFVTIQMKATAQYFHVVLFTMLDKVVLTFKFVDETHMKLLNVMELICSYFIFDISSKSNRIESSKSKRFSEGLLLLSTYLLHKFLSKIFELRSCDV